MADFKFDRPLFQTENKIELDYIYGLYLLRVHINGFPQTLILDTGSLWTWVNTCDEPYCLNIDCKAGEPRKINYGSGTVLGNFCNADFQILGFEAKN